MREKQGKKKHSHHAIKDEVKTEDKQGLAQKLNQYFVSIYNSVDGVDHWTNAKCAIGIWIRKWKLPKLR